MRVYEEKTVTEVQKTCVKLQCDVCKKEFDKDDWMEIQEFHHIDFTGGYGSVFGDGYDIQCDICQHCLLKMITGYYRSEEIY